MISLNKHLISGSLILLITFNIFNALNFFFQLSMARLLTVAEYGVLATLFAIIYILGVFSESIQTIITQYASREHDVGRLKNMFTRILNKSWKVACVMFLGYAILGILLAYLLHITYSLLLLNGVLIFFSFIIPISRGLLLGKKRFTALGLNMIIEASLKLLAAITLVYLGWKVYGAITGVLIGSFIALIVSFIPLRTILKAEEKPATITGIYQYSKPVFFLTLLIIAFYSIDVVIAKIFFSEEQAGAYAIASILSKIILFGTYPITKAMFPLSAEQKENTRASHTILLNALGIILLGIAAGLLIMYFFPSWLVHVFSGRVLPESVHILFTLALATSLISLTNLTIFYKLSKGYVQGYYFLGIFFILEIILLSYFSKDLMQFSLAFVTASAALLWGSTVLLKKEA